MAFGPKNINPEKKKEVSEQSVAIKENNDFLNPTADAKKDSENDLYRESLTNKTAFQRTMKTLNALKIVSPIIAALMQSPGVDAKNEELSESFRNLITEISSLANDICLQLNVDPTKEKNFWIRNVLERNFSEILGKQWIQHGKTDTGFIKEIVEKIVDFSENVEEKEKFADISDIHLLQLAGISSMSPILKEVSEFNLLRNFEDDIEHVMIKLKEKAGEATKQLADPYSNSEERAKIYYLLLKEAGELYAVSWRIESKRINTIMNSYPQEKLKTWVDKYKAEGGFPLNKIDSEFDKYFDKVVAISQKLVLSQSGTIKNRLKK